jgi:hypothetical protein
VREHPEDGMSREHTENGKLDDKIRARKHTEDGKIDDQIQWSPKQDHKMRKYGLASSPVDTVSAIIVAALRYRRKDVKKRMN